MASGQMSTTYNIIDHATKHFWILIIIAIIVVVDINVKSNNNNHTYYYEAFAAKKTAATPLPADFVYKLSRY
jgi:hypothetical protein